MCLMSDFREAMWGVVQQAHLRRSDVDFVEYADRHFARLLAGAADPRFDGWLEAAQRSRVSPDTHTSHRVPSARGQRGGPSVNVVVFVKWVPSPDGTPCARTRPPARARGRRGGPRPRRRVRDRGGPAAHRGTRRRGHGDLHGSRRGAAGGPARPRDGRAPRGPRDRRPARAAPTRSSPRACWPRPRAAPPRIS